MSTRIANALVRRGLLSQARADAALREEANTGFGFRQLVVERRWVDDAVFADVVAEETGSSRLDLQRAEVDPSLGQRIGESWSQTLDMVPLSDDPGGRNVCIAVVDPENVSGLGDLEFKLGRRAQAVVASRSEMDRLVRHVFHGEELDRRAPRTPPRRVFSDEIGEVVPGEQALQEEMSSQSLRPSSEFEELADVVRENQQAAEVLRAIVELCVEKGVLSTSELRSRIARDREREKKGGAGDA